MAPYSMDLRTRVLADCDAGMAPKDVAARFRVSWSWMNRLVQRRRETGEVVARQQKVFRSKCSPAKRIGWAHWWMRSPIGPWRNSARRYRALPACRRSGARWIGSS